MADSSITRGNISANGAGFTATATDAAGNAAQFSTTGGTTRDGSGGFAVAGGRGPIPGQLAYDPQSGGSESLTIAFDTAQTAIAVDIANLFANDGGNGRTEVGSYTALDADGATVAAGTFSADSGSTMSVDVDPDGDQTFSQVVFTAEPYAQGQDGVNNDSSDYWINEIRFETAEEPADDGSESERGEHRTVAIDFENLADTAEGDAIDNQYQASHNVTFEALGDVLRGQPVLAETGLVDGDFAGFGPGDATTDGTDVGSAFLTTGTAPDGGFGGPVGFVMNVGGDGAWRVAGDVLDLDRSETWTIVGRDADGDVVDEVTLSEGDDSGDAAATGWELSAGGSAAAIATVTFRAERNEDPATIGFGVDNIELDVAADSGSGDGDEADGGDGADDTNEGGDDSGPAREHDVVVIDFEDLESPAEGDILDDQYANLGVTFLPRETADQGTPAVGIVGAPENSFVPGDGVTDGTDIGEAFLTGVNALSQRGGTAGFRMQIDQGAWSVAGDLLDLDGGETWTITAFDGDGHTVDTVTLADPGDRSGDGAATAWELTADSEAEAIESVSFVGTRTDGLNLGFGFDNFEIAVDTADDANDDAGDQDGDTGDDGSEGDGTEGGNDDQGAGGEDEDGQDQGDGDGNDGGDGGGNAGISSAFSLVQDFGADYIAKVEITNTGDTPFFDWRADIDLGEEGALVTGWSSDINAPITVDGEGTGTGIFGTAEDFRRPLDPGESFTLHYQSRGGSFEDDSLDFDILDEETGGAANAQDLNATVQISDWGNGFIANLAIENTGSGPISNWTLEIDFGDSVIDPTDVWGGTAEVDGSTVTFDAATFNAAIPAGETVFAGFVAEDNSVDALQNVVEADSLTFI